MRYICTFHHMYSVSVVVKPGKAAIPSQNPDLQSALGSIPAAARNLQAHSLGPRALEVGL